MPLLPGHDGMLFHPEGDLGLWAHYRQEVLPGRPIAFLDRDGVLIHDHGYVGTAARTAPIAGALEAVAALSRAGWTVVIVTNQAGIGRGYFGWDGFREVQGIIDEAVIAEGGLIHAVLACAYHGEAKAPFRLDGHPWRKPAPGMLKAAIAHFRPDMTRSFMAGDQPTDLAAGQAAGVARQFLLDEQDTRLATVLEAMLDP